jgi:Arc/MetJ-type ribon-helix-helix transcriptional regulator
VIVSADLPESLVSQIDELIGNTITQQAAVQKRQFSSKAEAEKHVVDGYRTRSAVVRAALDQFFNKIA